MKRLLGFHFEPVLFQSVCLCRLHALFQYTWWCLAETLCVCSSNNFIMVTQSSQPLAVSLSLSVSLSVCLSVCLYCSIFLMFVFLSIIHMYDRGWGSQLKFNGNHNLAGKLSLLWIQRLATLHSVCLFVCPYLSPPLSAHQYTLFSLHKHFHRYLFWVEV